MLEARCLDLPDGWCCFGMLITLRSGLFSLCTCQCSFVLLVTMRSAMRLHSCLQQKLVLFACSLGCAPLVWNRLLIHRKFKWSSALVAKRVTAHKMKSWKPRAYPFFLTQGTLTGSRAYCVVRRSLLTCSTTSGKLGACRSPPFCYLLRALQAQRLAEVWRFTRGLELTPTGV